MIFLDRMFLLFPLPEDGLGDVFERPRRFAKKGHGKVQSLVFGFQLVPHDSSVVFVISERDHHAVREIRQAVSVCQDREGHLY